MGFRLHVAIRRASFSSSHTSSKVANVPKGYLALYVGEEMKWLVIPMPYLNQASFQDLLSQVKWRKNLDMIIQWVASQFLAQKMFSCTLLLASMGYRSKTARDWHRLVVIFCIIGIFYYFTLVNIFLFPLLGMRDTCPSEWQAKQQIISLSIIFV